MDRRLIRNVPVLIWWIAIIFALFAFPHLVLTAGLILLAATPLRNALLSEHLRGSDERPVPLCTINKFSEVANMTALSAVKAMMYSCKLPTSTQRKMLDKSKEALS